MHASGAALAFEDDIEDDLSEQKRIFMCTILVACFTIQNVQLNNPKKECEEGLSQSIMH